MEKFINSNYYELNGETIYKNVRPRILAEKFLDELAHDNILDYKFYSEAEIDYNDIPAPSIKQFVEDFFRK